MLPVAVGRWYTAWRLHRARRQMYKLGLRPISGGSSNAGVGPSGTIYDAAPAARFVFQAGDPDLNNPLGGSFQAGHVWVNNSSNQSLYLVDVPDVVPPGITRICTLQRTDVARASWSVPAQFNVTQASPASGAAILIFLNDGVDASPHPGVANNPAVSIEGAAGQSLGDVSAPTPSRDQGVTVATTSPAGATTCPGVMASFKAAAANVQVSQVGALGNFVTGTNTAVGAAQGLAFGQATTAGNFLWAWVESDSADPTTVAAGWAQAVKFRTANGLCSAIWYKPNCGAGEAVPNFTAAGGLGPMTAQLGEARNVALASPVDRTGTSQSTASPITVTNSARDVAPGDLIVMTTHWGYFASTTTGFIETFNNNTTAIHAGDDGAVSQNHHASHCYGIVPAASVPLPLGIAPWPYDVTGVSTPATGSQATVTLAASPTQRYIAHNLAASVISTTAVVSGARELQLKDGSTVLFQVSLSTEAVAGKGVTFAESGLAYAGSPNTAMTFSLDTGVANISERVSIGAYLR